MAELVCTYFIQVPSMIYNIVRTPPMSACTLVYDTFVPLPFHQYPGGLTRCETLVHFGNSAEKSVYRRAIFLVVRTYFECSSCTSSPFCRKSCIYLSGPSPARSASRPSISPRPSSSPLVSPMHYPILPRLYQQPLDVSVVALSGIWRVAMGSSCIAIAVSVHPGGAK